MAFEAKYYDQHDDLCHLYCPVTPEPRPVCPECFLELPVSGVCGAC